MNENWLDFILGIPLVGPLIGFVLIFGLAWVIYIIFKSIFGGLNNFFTTHKIPKLIYTKKDCINLKEKENNQRKLAGVKKAERDFYEIQSKNMLHIYDYLSEEIKNGVSDKQLNFILKSIYDSYRMLISKQFEYDALDPGKSNSYIKVRLTKKNLKIYSDFAYQYGREVELYKSKFRWAEEIYLFLLEKIDIGLSREELENEVVKLSKTRHLINLNCFKTTETISVTCSSCGGSGGKWDYQGGEFIDFNGGQKKWYPCSTCGGSGTVDEKKYLKIYGINT